MKRRMWIGIGIEIVRKIRVAKKTPPDRLYVGTFESVNVGLGLGLRLKERFGIEIGAAIGDWD